MINNKYLRRLLIVSSLCIIIHSDIALASSFHTPKNTMELLLDAVRRVDAHLWSECLSDIDKKIYSLSVGKKKELELLAEKSRAEMNCAVRWDRTSMNLPCFILCILRHMKHENQETLK